MLAVVDPDGHYRSEAKNGKGSTALTASTASLPDGPAAPYAPRNGKLAAAGAAAGSALGNAQNGHHQVQESNAKAGQLAEAADEQGPAQLQLFDLVYSLVRVQYLARLRHLHLPCCAPALQGFSCRALDMWLCCLCQHLDMFRMQKI